MKSILLFVIIISPLVTCAQVDKTKRDDQPAVYNVDSDDNEMNAAMKKAQSSFDTFLKAFNSENENQYGFAIKIPFPTDHGVEHIWLSDIQAKSGKFFGAIDNVPNEIKSIKQGDQVQIDIKKISDWFYIDDGKLVGGFTIRVIRNRMSPGERKQFDLDFGVKID